MNRNKLSTLIIILVAIGIGTYVIYDNQAGNQINSNEQRLQEYLENEGLDSGRGEDTENAFKRTDEVGVYPGAFAKDVTLPIYGEEQTMSFSDLQGDYVFVNLWATWCPPCIREMPDLIEFHEDYKDKNVKVIGVNMTTQESAPENIGEFIQDFEIPFPTLMDENGEVASNYQVFGIPITFVIDPEGRIIIRRQGEIDYEILESFYEEAQEKYKELQDEQL